MDVNSDKIRQFITDNFLFGRQIEVSDCASFLENGIIDSTGMLELISFLEQEHSIAIAAEELIPENLDSIDRVTRFLKRKLKESDRKQETAVW